MKKTLLTLALFPFIFACALVVVAGASVAAMLDYKPKPDAETCRWWWM